MEKNHIKIFRRSFWRTCIIRDLRLTFVMLIVIAFPIFYSMGFSLKMYLFFGLLFGSVFFPFFVLFLFYVILTDDRLIIKNGIFPFWKRMYFYKDIKEVHLVWQGYMSKYYIQVFTCRKKSTRYLIEDLVAPKDYQEIVNILREKGIFVEVKGLDQWVK